MRNRIDKGLAPSGERSVGRCVLLWLALSAALAGCGTVGDAPSLLPRLAPTEGAGELALSELGPGQAAFSDVSVYEAAMRPGYEDDLEAFAGATRLLSRISPFTTRSTRDMGTVVLASSYSTSTAPPPLPAGGGEGIKLHALCAARDAGARLPAKSWP